MTNITASMFMMAGSATARSILALYALAAAGYDKGPSVTWVSLARWECSGWWLQPRAGVLEGMYDPDCWPSRTCVGLELIPVDAGASYVIPPVISANTAIREALIGLDLVVVNPANNYLIAKPNLYQPANGEQIAGLLEAVIWDRNEAGLGLFSIGPTQLFLAGTPMYQHWADAPAGYTGSNKRLGMPAGGIAGFPQTWEDVFTLYTADKVETVASYLERAYPTSVWPGNAPWDRDRAVTFIRKYQTGGAPPYDKAQQYVDSHFLSNVQYYAAAWETIHAGTNQEAISLGLDMNIFTNNTVAYLSNPGPVGQDTGYEFTSKGQTIRVIAKKGESRSAAIKRVRARHGL